MRNHELVLAWIEAELAAGRLAVGQRLPGERAVAEQLNVSRASAREGIRVLEAMGVVRAGVGSGPGAGTVITANPAVALGSALRLHVASSHLPVEDIVQTRLLLETWAAGHAEGSAPSMMTAGDLLGEMDRPGLTTAEFLRLDALFHVAVAEAAGNVLISAMMSSLRGSIESYTQQLTSRLPNWHSTADRLRSEHRAIYHAIVAGADDDGAPNADASTLVANHIEGFYREAGL
ncbi:FCD domain-containing protein [Arthrobacter sp. H20]|uniref:FadR/GntR family transcriptional regulator n=1 Tax=Arthrobacter sp. H20 TaxID=1267981 RepID=UPI00047974D1|nr:FCD domain-containing protein [Arthrobacter sp. H20]